MRGDIYVAILSFYMYCVFQILNDTILNFYLILYRIPCFEGRGSKWSGRCQGITVIDTKECQLEYVTSHDVIDKDVQGERV